MGHASFGKYRLIAELGHGGMADVFLAVQAGPAGSRFRKLSVIKKLRQNLADDPEFIAMLLEEARIASRLNHPNVVQTNEVSAVDDQYYIAMEYLDGQPLHRVQHRLLTRARQQGKKIDRTMNDALIVALMDTLAGLHHAHDLHDYDGEPLSVVHRDVTPHNIFITYAGQVKVVDFGVAKAAGRAAETRQGIVKGKVRYMAPEHAAGKAIDRRADIFAVGVLLWEQLTGRRMWKDMDDLLIVQHLVNGAPARPPREIDPSISPEVEKICLRALARNPEDRYATAEAMRVELEQAFADSGRLIAARRALAPLVTSMFEDKRSEMKAIIEQQLAELEAVGSGEFEPARLGRSSPSFPVASLTPTPPPGSTAGGTAVMQHRTLGLERPPATSSVAPLAPLPSAGGLPTLGDARASGRPLSGGLSSNPPGVSAHPKRAANARSGILALTILMCGLAAALAGVIVTRRATPAPAAAAPAPSAREAPSITHVTLRLDASPKDATISIDDGPPEDVPLVVKVMKDSRDHIIRVEAPGYEPKVEIVRYESDLTAIIALEKNAQPPSFASRAAASTPARKTPASLGTSEAANETKAQTTTPAPTTNAEYVTPSGRPPKYERQNTKLDREDPWKE